AFFTPQDANGVAGEPQVVAEYFGVSEEKLNAMPADKIKELQTSGALAQIYAHLVSLIGWDRLVALAMTRQQQGAGVLN
ncbi:MAG: SapC family protein, partial [Gemmatimonadaceae bacterium]|nr:SapC family protein [Caulobacter sp.]